jgi:hypothetical protein
MDIKNVRTVNDAIEYYRERFTSQGRIAKYLSGKGSNEFAPRVGLSVEAKVRSTPEINHVFLPGEIGAVLDWEVRDTNTGEIALDPRTGKPNVGIKKAESFTRQMIDLLMIKFLGHSPFYPMYVKNTSNVLVEVCETNSLFNTDAAIADVTMGIIIGTGVGAPTISDFAIGIIIPHATMNYSAMTYGAPASDATTSQFTMTRNFANVSGGNVTVNEVALYVKANSITGLFDPDPTPNIYFFMTIRDVIAGGITVPNGQTLTINYRPQCVV